MPDYSKGKIYEIVCRITGEKYVGSTLELLSRRLTEHRQKNNKCSSKPIIERGDYYINLLENYPCNSKEELRKREREWYDKIEGGCINKNRPCITKEEYIEYQKEYREENKDLMIEYREANRIYLLEKKKEYREANKTSIKEYYKKNRIYLLEKQKEYNNAKKLSLAEKNPK